MPETLTLDLDPATLAPATPRHRPGIAHYLDTCWRQYRQREMTDPDWEIRVRVLPPKRTAPKGD